MKFIKIAIILILILAIAASAFLLGGEKRIGRDAALRLALEDAGLTREQVVDVSIDYEREHGTAWYEVEFEYGGTEYEYDIHAYTGEILSAGTERS